MILGFKKTLWREIKFVLLRYLLIRNVKTIKYHNKDPEKRAKEIFLQKKFLLLSEKAPSAGLLREKTKFFLQKIFVFSLFEFLRIMILYCFNVPYVFSSTNCSHTFRYRQSKISTFFGFVTVFCTIANCIRQRRQNLCVRCTFAHNIFDIKNTCII